jgi:phosphoribosyl-dephospho-CoA transferase
MDIRVHDLLRINDIDHLITTSPKPEWVHESLLHAPFVVVRRAPIQNGNIPIGIRGKSQGERFAAFLPKEAVAECVTPE